MISCHRVDSVWLVLVAEANLAPPRLQKIHLFPSLSHCSSFLKAFYLLHDFIPPLQTLFSLLNFFSNLTRGFFFPQPNTLRNLSRNLNQVFAITLTTNPLLSPSGDLGIGLVWHNLSGPDSFLVRLMKSSSNWTKSSMMGPQLFLGWYQMIFRLGSDWVQFRFRLGSDYVQTRFSVGTE